MQRTFDEGQVIDIGCCALHMQVGAFVVIGCHAKSPNCTKA